MFQAAKKVQGFHKISDHMEAGGVAAVEVMMDYESNKVMTLGEFNSRMVVMIWRSRDE